MKKLILSFLAIAAFTGMQIEAATTLINSCPFSIYTNDGSNIKKILPQSSFSAPCSIVSKSSQLTIFTYNPSNPNPTIPSSIMPNLSININDGRSKMAQFMPAISVRETDYSTNISKPIYSQQSPLDTLYIKPSSTVSGLTVSTTP